MNARYSTVSFTILSNKYKIWFLILLSSFLLLNVSSCKKGEPEKFPDFASILFNINVKPLNGNITLKVDDDPEILISGLKRVDMLAGERHFLFADAGRSVLDTVINIPASTNSPYLLFRPAEGYAVQLFDLNSLGMDTVYKPKENFIKIRIANYAKHLPKEVDILFLINTYIDGQQKLVEAGSINNISNSAFSGYKEILIGKNESGEPMRRYSIILKNSQTKEIVQNDSVSINGVPYTYNTSGDADFIFTAYLSGEAGNCDDSTCTIATLTNLASSK